jgi:hypothetical protein
VRIATAVGASLAIAAALNTALPGPGWDRHQLVSLGAAAVTALGISTVLFARRWLGPRRAGIVVVAIAYARTVGPS